MKNLKLWKITVIISLMSLIVPFIIWQLNFPHRFYNLFFRSFVEIILNVLAFVVFPILTSISMCLDCSNFIQSHSKKIHIIFSGIALGVCILASLLGCLFLGLSVFTMESEEFLGWSNSLNKTNSTFLIFKDSFS